MRFGPVPVAAAGGAILAHAARLPDRVLRKGQVLQAADLADLDAAGIATVIVAEPDPGEIGEDEAARRCAAPLVGPDLRAAEPYTGRVNLHAEADGLLIYEPAAIDRLNRIDPDLTLATLGPHARVGRGDMVATVKIIPFAVAAAAVEAWVASAAPLRLARFRPMRAGLIQTRLAGTKPTVLDRTREVTRQRLRALGSTLDAETRVAHETAALAEAIRYQAGRELILIVGASAIVDRRDVIPAAIEAAGGRVVHFGMPVDPGNLLLVGEIGGRPVIGLPGCARSPKLNGVDWVLERLAAGLRAGRDEILRMGPGGLLAEMPGRPSPRATARPPALPAGPPKIAAIILAAGRSTRMGTNKLLLDCGGTSLIERVADQALAARARPLLVVTGHEAAAIRARLGDRPLTVVDNPLYADGLASSIRAGLAALPADAEGVLILLGDMPDLEAGLIDRMIAAFDPAEGREIIVPVRKGRRGNPVLWSRRFLPALGRIEGDAGGRHLIGEHAPNVVEVVAETDGPLIDLDTEEALARWRAGEG